MARKAALSAFQSTPPIREETTIYEWGVSMQEVSIHSSHTGGDNIWVPSCSKIACFNPLLPYGRRLANVLRAGKSMTFQSTPPIREETVERPDNRGNGAVSIHSSHTGGDVVIASGYSLESTFQSTPPIREETTVSSATCSRLMFQSTPPIREETLI